MEFPFNQAPESGTGAATDDFWGFNPQQPPPLAGAGADDTSLEDLLALYQTPTEPGAAPFAPMGEPDSYPSFPDFGAAPAGGEFDAFGAAGAGGFGDPATDQPFPDFGAPGGDFGAPGGDFGGGSDFGSPAGAPGGFGDFGGSADFGGSPFGAGVEAAFPAFDAAPADSGGFGDFGAPDAGEAGFPAFDAAAVDASGFGDFSAAPADAGGFGDFGAPAFDAGAPAFDASPGFGADPFAAAPPPPAPAVAPGLMGSGLDAAIDDAFSWAPPSAPVEAAPTPAPPPPPAAAEDPFAPAAGTDPFAMGGDVFATEDDPFAPLPGGPSFPAFDAEPAAEAFPAFDAEPAAEDDPFAPLPGAPLFPAFDAAISDDDPFAPLPGGPSFPAFDESSAAAALPAEDDPFAPLPGGPSFPAFDAAGYEVAGPGGAPEAAFEDDPFAPLPGSPSFPAFDAAGHEVAGPGGAPAAAVEEDDPFAPLPGSPSFPAFPSGSAAPYAAAAVSGDHDPEPAPAEDPFAPPAPTFAGLDAGIEAAPTAAMPEPVIPAVAAHTDPDQTLRYNTLQAPIAAVTVPFDPAAFAALTGQEVTLRSADDRRGLTSQLSQVVGMLNASLDEVQGELAQLYAELQRAAVRRAPVGEIMTITEQLATARSRIGEGSEAHKHALFLRQTADAYLQLMQEL